MRAFLVCAVLLSSASMSPLLSLGQSSDSSQGESAICAFEDGKQLTARYNPIATGRSDGPPTGKVLTPGGSAMTFFTETPTWCSARPRFLPVGTQCISFPPRRNGHLL